MTSLLKNETSVNQSIHQSINNPIHCLQKYIYTMRHYAALGVFHTKWGNPQHGNRQYRIVIVNAGFVWGRKGHNYVTILKSFLKTGTSK